MTPLLRIGILGCGQITREVHLPILRSMAGIRLTALADSDPEAARRCAAADIPVFGSLAEMLDAVDAVVVATPTGVHARHAKEVLLAGKGLYLEKPLAATLPEAEEVAVLDNGRAAMGFNYRFHPLHERARRRIAAGDWGVIRSVRSQFSFAPRVLPQWKRTRASGGGVLLDLASHHFDLIGHLLGQQPVRVRAEISSVHTEHDTASLTIEFSGGARAECLYSFCTSEFDALELVGDRRVTLNRYAPLRFPLFPAREWIAYHKQRLASPWREVSFRRSLEAWIAALRGSGPLATDLADGLRAMRTVAAAERSAEMGQAVAI